MQISLEEEAISRHHWAARCGMHTLWATAVRAVLPPALRKKREERGTQPGDPNRHSAEITAQISEITGDYEIVCSRIRARVTGAHISLKSSEQ